MGKPEGGRPLRTPRHWWEDNIEEIGWVSRIGFIWLRIETS
jgi:hypothetical protein